MQEFFIERRDRMKANWYWNEIKSGGRSIYKKATGKQLKSAQYAGKNVYDENSGSEYLRKLITSNQPFVACRYGQVELETMAAVYEFIISGNDRKLNHVIKKGDIFNNAGFFPKNKEQVVEFGKMMLEYSSEIDMLGVWYIPYEEYFISQLSPKAALTYLRTFEPWNEVIPWTRELAGKKVLVIHPFDKTINKQYSIRDKIFTNKEILPEFKLITYPAVQTIAGNIDPRFSTWFEALDMMFDDCMKIDFDIAVLGCGAYGFPLACKLKKAGKQVVHIGGATQLLFGIKGSRWDNHPVVSKLYNEYWIRPDKSEIPQNAQRVENKCYW